MTRSIEENLKIIFDFVERYNKQDQEEDVAQACVELEEGILQVLKGVKETHYKAYKLGWEACQESLTKP